MAGFVPTMKEDGFWTGEQVSAPNQSCIHHALQLRCIVKRCPQLTGQCTSIQSRTIHIFLTSSMTSLAGPAEGNSRL